MAAPQIPMGGTYFDTLKKSFKDVPVDANNNISTAEFCEAAESLTTLFGQLCDLFDLEMREARMETPRCWPRRPIIRQKIFGLSKARWGENY